MKHMTKTRIDMINMSIAKCVCVCMCVCLCACVRACVRVCVRVGMCVQTYDCIHFTHILDYSNLQSSTSLVVGSPS